MHVSSKLYSMLQDNNLWQREKKAIFLEALLSKKRLSFWIYFDSLDMFCVDHLEIFTVKLFEIIQQRF